MRTTDLETSDLSLFWAKTDRAKPTSPTYHPLICHLIDVGVVAYQIWDTILSPAMRQSIASGLGLEVNDAGRWVSFLAGAHDLGKLSPCFQFQQQAAITRLSNAGWPPPVPIPPNEPHGVITTLCLSDHLRSRFKTPPTVASTLATVVGGHHGIFPSTDDLSDLGTKTHALGRGAWAVARDATLSRLGLELCLPSGTKPDRIDNPTAMVLAGLISVADWIGSNQDHFTCAVTEDEPARIVDPTVYARGAPGKAIDALRRLGWVDWSPSRGVRSFSGLFPKIPTANPMQAFVISLAARLREQALVLIEVPTGEGKTEAAMYLADRWAVDASQTGHYFALPTQATSNQMFSRVKEFLEGRYAGQTVDLQLLHGHATLSAEFELLRRNAKLRDGGVFRPSGIDAPPSEDGTQASVVAAEWFTYRKRGLLAPFGVGTVDQMLLAILKTRHVFVRLFGLARKTVIIDEVHAYDTYMSALVDQLLTWLAALGTSVVLLSATLPNCRRVELAEAYAKGLPHPPPIPLLPAHYPRITWVARSTVGDGHVQVSNRSRKKVRLVWQNGVDFGDRERLLGFASLLRASLLPSGCAAIVCNTVGRAQRMYWALNAALSDNSGPNQFGLDLLHARFPFHERDRREKLALLRFGKPGGDVRIDADRVAKVRRPRLAVVVATQIIEQSLDLDFDLLVTDVAPADLVLQRIGRLWRHKRRNRRAGFREPTVWLLAPPLNADGLPEFDAGTARVYDDDHVLLRSWLALRAAGDVLSIPEDVESLVEGVYAEQSCTEPTGPLADRWASTLERHRKEVAHDRQEAMERWLKPPSFAGDLWKYTTDPREEDAPTFHRAHQALTRLSELTVQVVCLYGTEAHPTLEPFGVNPVDLLKTPNLEMTKSLLSRSVLVSDKRVVWALLEQGAPAGWRQSALLRHSRHVIFNERATASIDTKYFLHLDPDLGLLISDSTGGFD